MDECIIIVEGDGWVECEFVFGKVCIYDCVMFELYKCVIYIIVVIGEYVGGLLIMMIESNEVNVVFICFVYDIMLFNVDEIGDMCYVEIVKFVYCEFDIDIVCCICEIVVIGCFG